MVVVVDENAGENATADLEEQLAVLGERWSSVCKWTEQRFAWVLVTPNMLRYAHVYLVLRV